MRTTFFRQRQLARHVRIGGDQAGHRVVGIDRAVLGQCLHGREAAAAGDHGPGAGIGGTVDTDDQVLQQAMGRRWRPSSRPRRPDRPASCVRSRGQAPAGRAEPPGSAVRAGVRCDSCESPSIWAGHGWNGRGGDGLSGRPAPAPARPGSTSVRGSGGLWATIAGRRRALTGRAGVLRESGPGGVPGVASARSSPVRWRVSRRSFQAMLASAWTGG